MTERAEHAAQAAEKSTLRQSARAARRALAPALVRARSEATARRLLDDPTLRGARTIAIFAGMEAERELDPRLADPLLRARGLVPVYPRVVGKAPPRLSFHAAAPDKLRESRFGVPEPDASSPEVPLAQIDAFVVPGLAFTRAGARLGYGGGYDDATLAAAPRAARLAWAHPEQLVDHLPESPRDERVDSILTPEETFACAPGRRGRLASGDPS